MNWVGRLPNNWPNGLPAGLVAGLGLTAGTAEAGAEFRSAGWEFGQSVINVVRCPCCPKDAQPDPDRVQTKAALEELLGDDEDGLAAAFEDYRL